MKTKPSVGKTKEAEETGETKKRGAVSEAEVDREVAEYHAIAQRAGFEQRVRIGQAGRLGDA
jgi:hypothetical protein